MQRSLPPLTKPLMSRTNVMLTGLVGLVGAMVFTALCLFVVVQEWIPILFSGPAVVWGLFLFLAVFSIAEIPVMIFGMRKIVESGNPRAENIALFTNAVYIFFAAAYAAPIILLTGSLWSGVALAS